jgi:hypothetical protein
MKTKFTIDWAQRSGAVKKSNMKVTAFWFGTSCSLVDADISDERGCLYSLISIWTPQISPKYFLEEGCSAFLRNVSSVQESDLQLNSSQRLALSQSGSLSSKGSIWYCAAWPRVSHASKGVDANKWAVHRVTIIVKQTGRLAASALVRYELQVKSARQINISEL